MNKHYKSALIEAAAEKLTEKGLSYNYDELREIVETSEAFADDCTGNFDEDVDCLVREYLDYWDDWDEFEDDSDEDLDEDELEEEDSEKGESLIETFQEMIDGLHVGVNLIPGLGIAVANDEEDLKALKEHLQGWLQIAGALSRLLGA